MWRHAVGMQNPDLAGGGWRWRGRGAIGAFGSGGILLMWESTYVWDSSQNLTIRRKKIFSHTCTRARQTSLSLLPAKVAWPGERRVEEHEDEGVGRKDLWRPSWTNVTTGQVRARQPESPAMAWHAVQVSDRIFSMKTHLNSHASCTAGFPVWPWVRLYNCRNECQCEWVTQKCYDMQHQPEHFSQSRTSAQAAQESWPVLFQVQRGPFDREEGPRTLRRSRRRGEAGGIQNAAVQHSSPEINNSVWIECFWCASARFCFFFSTLSSHLSKIGLWASGWAGLSLWVSLGRLSRCGECIVFSCLFSSLCLLFASFAWPCFQRSSGCFSLFTSSKSLILPGSSNGFSFLGSGLFFSLRRSCTCFCFLLSVSGGASSTGLCFLSSSRCFSFLISCGCFSFWGASRCFSPPRSFACLFLFLCSSFCFSSLVLLECFLSGSESCFGFTSNLLWLTKTKDV